ncbi:MAG: glycoside hydrolase family 5 protein [Lachnospiraceae bacterium]|nr:glycoside hydrolase family 5 protein [Lachnospiraceae bacterium]
MNSRIKKRITSITLAVMLSCSMFLSGCGKGGQVTGGSTESSEDTGTAAENTDPPRGIRSNIGTDGDYSSGNATVVVENGSEESLEEKDTADEPEGNTEADVEIVVDASDISSVDFVKNMGYGWNLGNALDATNCDWVGNKMDYEGAWCGVKATPELIEAVNNAGFTTIRIPVSWHDHVDSNYNIDSQWMDRVQEVVDYAYDRDMYVILDVHHDVTEDYYFPTKDKLNQSKSYMEAVWTQISERFADYDEKLIFESINEPRLVGRNNEWWYDKNVPECPEAMECINECNQVFVDTVRNSGGWNKERFLIVASYDDAYEPTVDAGFKLPSDTVNDRLLVAVHMYLPYDFAGNPNGTTVFDDSAKRANDTALNAVYDRFVAKGVGVVIDEYGAMNKGNDDQRVLYYDYFTKAAKDLGMCTVAWDNNVFEVSTDSTQGFGLIDYGTKKVVKTEIIDAIVK